MTAKYRSGAELTTAITAFHKRTATLEKDCQTLLVEVSVQAIDHGNTEPVNQLFAGMGKGLRSSAIASWLSMYCPVLPNDDKESAKTKPFVLDKTQRAAINESETIKADHIKAATLDSWTTHKPEAVVLESFDVAAALRSALKAMTAKAGKATTVQHSELLAAVSTLLGDDIEEPAGEPAFEPAPL